MWGRSCERDHLQFCRKTICKLFWFISIVAEQCLIERAAYVHRIPLNFLSINLHFYFTINSQPERDESALKRYAYPVQSKSCPYTIISSFSIHISLLSPFRLLPFLKKKTNWNKIKKAMPWPMILIIGWSRRLDIFWSA